MRRDMWPPSADITHTAQWRLYVRHIALKPDSKNKKIRAVKRVKIGRNGGNGQLPRTSS